MEYSRREVASQPVRLAPRPVFLAGREGLLAELDTKLSADNGQPGPRVVALSGLGGAGKTSVAVEYAHRHLTEVGLAWQFPADEPSVMAAGFGELAAQLGARELLDPRDPMTSVHGVLAAYRAEWLLVFDNAPSRASVQAFLPPAGRGRVLITSRNQIWPPGQALEVPVLDQQTAAGFLRNRTGDPDERAALELAGELGGLPLALEQAAAYVQASGGTLAGYLALFRRRRADLLGRGEPTGYPGTVATTWTLAFEDLAQAAPGAAGLLRLLAFCAPETIPLRLLLQPRPGLAGQLGSEVASVLGSLLEDPLAAGDAIAALRRRRATASRTRALRPRHWVPDPYRRVLTRAGEQLAPVHRRRGHPEDLAFVALQDKLLSTRGQVPAEARAPPVRAQATSDCRPVARSPACAPCLSPCHAASRL